LGNESPARFAVCQEAGARGKEPYLDTAIYHCQQLTEKVVKGWLVYHDISFSKTHDLRLLVALAAETEPAFNKRLNVAERITPYATAFVTPARYWSRPKMSIRTHSKPLLNFMTLFVRYYLLK